MSNKAKRCLCLLIFGIGLLNFAIFLLIALYLGGDAVNGKAVAGHYYLASHGRYTEVTENVFTYSRWHVFSTWVTHPLAFLAGYLYYRIKDGEDVAPPA